MIFPLSTISELFVGMSQTLLPSHLSSIFEFFLFEDFLSFFLYIMRWKLVYLVFPGLLFPGFYYFYVLPFRDIMAFLRYYFNTVWNECVKDIYQIGDNIKKWKSNE